MSACDLRTVETILLRRFYSECLDWRRFSTDRIALVQLADGLVHPVTMSARRLRCISEDPPSRCAEPWPGGSRRDPWARLRRDPRGRWAG
jgi:hypothetical protein